MNSETNIFPKYRDPFLKKTVPFILILLFCLVSPYVFSQGSQGKIRYLVNQNFSKMMAAVKYLSQRQKDQIQYLSSEGQGWNSYMEMYFTQSETMYLESEEVADKRSQGYSWRAEAFFIHRDFAKSRMTDLVKFLNKTYVIDDELVMPKWKILNDIKEVAGHMCMDAFREDSLRGQKITAWFALDMPISGGPENLCGLPGMILEVNVNDGAMVIAADKIDLVDASAKVKLPEKIKGKKINLAAYNNLLKKYFDEKRKAEEFPFFAIRYL